MFVNSIGKFAPEPAAFARDFLVRTRGKEIDGIFNQTVASGLRFFLPASIFSAFNLLIPCPYDFENKPACI